MNELEIECFGKGHSWYRTRAYSVIIGTRSYELFTFEHPLNHSRVLHKSRVIIAVEWKESNVSGLTSRIICTPMNSTNYSPCYVWHVYVLNPHPHPPWQKSIDAVISGSLSGKRLYRNWCVPLVSSAQKSIWNFICTVNSPLNAKSRLGH